MKGIAVLFDTHFDEGWRSDMDIMLIATWNDKGGEIYTDISMSPKSIKCPVHDLSDFDWGEHNQLVGHNLHGRFKDSCFDILLEVKEASAKVLQNEGKRYPLFQLARWNRCRSLPVEMVSQLRRAMALSKGQHIKVARWALEDARLCHDLYRKVQRTGRVRFYDAKTGKKPYTEVSWGIDEEE